MRRLARLALLALLVIITFLYPLLAPTAHRIDQAHFDLITDGMSKAEVEAIFGVPAGDYDWATEDYTEMLRHLAAYAAVDRNSGFRVGGFRMAIQSFANSHETLPPSVWLGSRGFATIHFDERERVTAHRYFWPTVRIEPPWTRWWATLRGQQ